MLYIPFLLAAGSFPTLISGLPVPSFVSDIVETIQHSRFLNGRESANTYALFGGNGETSAGWPAQSDWVSSFDTMFAANKAIISISCAEFGVPDNSDAETAELSTAIQSVATSTGIDPRFILAIVMQESKGCVRAPTTNYGVRNPGLMQSHNGAGTCNDGTVSNPCPSSEITQMITDGAAGTSSGDGLKQCLTESGASDVSRFYKAARIYNSGSIASGGNLGAGIATHCYASDVANRLIGWVSGTSGCQEATVGSITTSESFVSGSSGSSEPQSVAPVATPTSTSVAAPVATSTSAGGIFIQTAASIAPVPTTTAVSTPTSEPIPVVTSIAAPVVTATVVPIAATTTAAPPPPPPATTTTSTPPVSTPTTVSSSAPYGNFPGVSSTCQEFYTVQEGDYCDLVDQKFNISLDQLVSWNSGLDYACSNLWLGYAYCVKA